MKNYEIDDIIESLEQLKALNAGIRKLGSKKQDYPHQFSHSDWECKGSPTNFCMYTVDWDSCIFCGEPDERK